MQGKHRDPCDHSARETGRISPASNGDGRWLRGVPINGTFLPMVGRVSGTSPFRGRSTWEIGVDEEMRLAQAHFGRGHRKAATGSRGLVSGK